MNVLKLLFIYSIALSLTACGGSNSNTEPVDTEPVDTEPVDTEPVDTEPVDDKRYRLQAPSGDEKFAEFLKKALINAYATKSFYRAEAFSDEGAGSAAVNTSSNITSNTNLQEQGVDESDIIKTDYPYIFQLDKTGAELKSLKYDETDQDLNNLDRIKITTTEGHTLSGLYLHTVNSSNRQAIIISKRNHNIFADWFMPIIDWHTDNTELHWVNTNNAENLSFKYSMNLDGDLISSRKVGSTLYMVMRHSPVPAGVVMPYTEDDLRNNKALIEQASIQDLMPKITFDNQSVAISADNCYLTPYTNQNFNTTQIVYTVAINVTSPSSAPKAQCIAGNIEAVYASPEAMYLATTRYQYSPDAPMVVYPVSQITTDLHKFNLEKGNISYRGSGSVTGHLGWEQDKKSFRMGEYNDKLRIISYIGRTSDEIESPARLHILSETSSGDLEITAELPNNDRSEPLGKPGEQIYSTRFIGNRGYLVTFRSVDPLYILDLSNPSDPFIAGELNIEGYSDYLHPVNDQLLIGIGKDAIAATGPGDGNFAWYQGIKVSLFDISNPAAPVEINKDIIGKRGSSTAVSYDHRAFSSIETTDNKFRFALPVSKHTVGADSSDPRTHYDWSSDNLHVYDIPLTGTPNLIRNDSLSKELINGSFPKSTQDDRSVLINNTAHYLLGGKIWH